jgi:hypothetical protein
MGDLLKIKCVESRPNMHIVASINAPFTFTMVQVPNLYSYETDNSVQTVHSNSKLRNNLLLYLTIKVIELFHYLDR